MKDEEIDSKASQDEKVCGPSESEKAQEEAIVGLQLWILEDNQTNG
jgi:hypothetical protein